MTRHTGGEYESRRVIIEHVQPEVDGGRFAVKRIVGDEVLIEADIFADGHDFLRAVLYHRACDEEAWQEAPMVAGFNDHWTASFKVTSLKPYTYRIEAWPDRFFTWQRDLRKRIDAEQDVSLELRVGADLVRAAAKNAPKADAERLEQRATALEEKDWALEVRGELAFDEALTELMERYGPREPLTVYDRQQVIQVDRERARFSAWYELFPRSTSPIPGKQGTLRTTIAWLPYISQMGFDVVYLPPVHPIGKTNHKGRNNDPKGGPADPGSPWAIGGTAGGHKAINPDLGTLEDFRDLVEAAKARDMEIAIDIALQVSPDHPYVKEHPSWFRKLPDGTIRYAENPPKLYQDIYPIDFETEDREGLWLELESIFRFWIEQGVRIFRVDNPHTKQFAFWEWMIARVRKDCPEVLFLAEAFTRPRTMYYLAKAGFSQSYTYFAWRNTRYEIIDYFTELTQTEVKEYFRPNLWPNTPDILNEYLQTGGRPAFVIRLILAATLGSNYGIYGPAFELAVAEPREHDSEEYRDSEKYEVRHWDVTAPHSLKDLIARMNRIRREHTALQQTERLIFCECANEQIIAYCKTSGDGEDVVLTIVNLDPHNTQSGQVKVPLWEMGVPTDAVYEAHDLLEDAHYSWWGEWNFVELNPHISPAHVLHLTRLPRREV